MLKPLVCATTETENEYTDLLSWQTDARARLPMTRNNFAAYFFGVFSTVPHSSNTMALLAALCKLLSTTLKL